MVLQQENNHKKKNNDKNKKTLNLDFSVRVNPGTLASRISAFEKLLSAQNGTLAAHNITTGTVFFDFKKHHHEDLLDMVESQEDLLNVNDNGYLVKAGLPNDRLSLEKLEAAGKLYTLPKNWLDTSGHTFDNLGSGGLPRCGAALALANEVPIKGALRKALGICISHDKHLQVVMQGGDTDANSARKPVTYNASLPTGTANGTIGIILSQIRQLADDLNIPIKLVIKAICYGDLPIDDELRARINESNVLKFLLASASGQFVDPKTGLISKQVFDQLLLSSNRNNWGRLSSLEQLVAENAYSNFLLWSSSISGQIHERMIDNEHQELAKDTGEPLVGSTAATSSLKWDREKVRKYCTYRGVELLAGTLGQKQSESEAQKQALAMARMDGVIESDEDSNITGMLLGTSEPKGLSIINQFRSNFTDRFEGTRGLERGNCLEESINSIDSNDIDAVYGQSMSEQSKRFLVQVQKSLDNRTAQTMKGSLRSNRQDLGCFDVYSGAVAYRNLAASSRGTISEKIGLIQQFMEPHREVLNSALEELDRIRNQPRWLRFLACFRLKRICGFLESSGRTYLECRLQIKACTIAVEVLDKLIDFIDDMLGNLSLLRQNILQVYTACLQKADAEINRPTLLSLIPGPDLVTADYLRGFIGKVVKQHGGHETFNQNLIAKLLYNHGSLSSLAGKSPDEIEEILSNVCREVFDPCISQCNVITEFHKLYPHEVQQRRIFGELNHQSEGGICTVGETDKEIVWTQFAIVPAAEHSQQILNLVTRIDDKPGTWHTLVGGNPDVITLLQFRGGISVASLIRSLKLPDNQSMWQQVIELAVEPFTAIMPLPNPTARQLRRVFVKAVLNNQLKYDEDEGFSLVFSDDETIALGKDTRAACKTLGGWWPHIVRIESSFGYRIVLDDKDVSRRIDDLKTSMAANNGDRRFVLIDERVVREVETQLNLFIPRAERLRVAREAAELNEI